ncbi:hypothetical protein TSUD_189760 [Trifolium subterraneum]|uniref:Alpha/beta hydrolase fold-3 domain-containing protein n=1 Tax=Trifolium subterraneum TaxID=3900 RepID=A0A2Z6NX39_TRISU|nr:hypothetical protein TSUD_189760 [Trifolium subterraneum]
MPSQTLPITNLQLPNLSSSSSSSTTTMLLKDNNDDYDNDNDPSKSLLISPSFNNNNKIMSIKPLLSRSSSFNSIGGGVGVNSFNQKRRRRVASEDSLSFVSNGTSSNSNGSSSFGRDVRHVASETFLLTRLGLKLDLFLPRNSDGPKPVVAFITGGAWIIGYKAWGSLLGQQLSERDIIVACIDYSRYGDKYLSYNKENLFSLLVTSSILIALSLLNLFFSDTLIGAFGPDPPVFTTHHRASIHGIENLK